MSWICDNCKKDAGTLKHLKIEGQQMQLCSECLLDLDPTETLSHFCVECGARTREGQWINMDELKFFQLCHSCNFWVGYLIPDQGKRQVITADDNGSMHHHMAGEEPSSREDHRWSGFGGSEMGIEFHNGETLVSHNLWSQGAIPAHFNDRFKDNAYVKGLVHCGRRIEVAI